MSWNFKVGAAGGIVGTTNDIAKPGTQIGGYAFGIGQNGNGKANSDGVGGGGSGYYGGETKNISEKSSGAGGSSYISGLVGCDAISNVSTEGNIVHTGQVNHYSGYVFTNAITISGTESMPTFDGTGNMIGNTGDGYAKINYIE